MARKAVYMAAMASRISFLDRTLSLKKSYMIAAKNRIVQKLTTCRHVLKEPIFLRSVMTHILASFVQDHNQHVNLVAKPMGIAAADQTQIRLDCFRLAFAVL